MTGPGMEGHPLDDLLTAVTRYVVLPSDHAARAVTLWIAATHGVGCFQHAPRLALRSPAKRCGKSRLLDVIAATCSRPLLSVNATVAAIFRSIGTDVPPTLIIDEADTIFGSKKVAEQNEDLRGLLNAGHQRGRPALRCVGPQQTPTEFATFAMAALAGIGGLPDTITDRAVNIEMRRRAPGEQVSTYRTRRDEPALHELRDRLAAWVTAHSAELSAAEPDMPVEDRAADTWEPLVAIADTAGGQWPAYARAACLQLVTEADAAEAEDEINVRLLTDIRTIFTERRVTFMSSADLIYALRQVEESPWESFDFNASRLSHRLREFNVRTERNTTGTGRGYRIETLTDAFNRYLTPVNDANRPVPRQDPSTRQNMPLDLGKPFDALKSSDASTRQPVKPENPITAGQTASSDALTPSDRGSGRTCERCHTPVTGRNVLCPECITELTAEVAHV